MSLFTSRRERRYWLYFVAAVAAIYSTLGIAGALAAALEDRGLIGLAFGAGFLTVIGAILASGLRRSPGPRMIWVGIGIAAVYGMVAVRLFIEPLERTHLFEYGIVALLVREALLERARNGRLAYSPALLAILIGTLVGCVDEGIQAALPNRVFDLRDIVFNTLAAAMAVTASAAVAWASRGRSGDGGGQD